jgi:hypothetical protein
MYYIDSETNYILILRLYMALLDFGIANNPFISK